MDETKPQPDDEQPEGEPVVDETPADGETDETSDEEINALAELPADLATADESALRELYDGYQSIYEERAPQAQTVAHRDYLRDLRSRQSAIAEELSRRRIEAQEVAESLAELQDAPALPDAAPSLASVGDVTGARPKQTRARQEPSSSPEKPKMAMVGGESSDRPGQPITHERVAAEAEEILRNRAWTGRARLAGVAGFDSLDGSPEALSGDNGARRNDALIREAVEEFNAERAARRASGDAPARTAAICQPFDIIREIPEDFVTDEPVSSMWPKRPIGRLAFQMTDGIGLADVDDGVATWDEDDQDLVDPTDPDTWKPCVEVDCPTPRSVTAEAVVACLTFRNDTEMSNPERVRHFQSAVNALRARIKEGRQLQIVDSLSSAYKWTGPTYGALPTLSEALNSLIAPLNYVNRSNPFGYDVIIPPGLLQVLSIDRANRAYGHESDPADVLAQLRADLEGVNAVVVSLDASLGGQPGLPFDTLNPVGDPADEVPRLSRSFRVRIVDPSAAIYGETGELYAGVQRGPDLVRQNRAQWFAEEYFLLAKHGVQPWAYVDVSLCSDGSRAGLIDPDDYVCGPAS